MTRRTAAQEEAVRAEGNLLLSAGAGSGKTTTIIQRCLDRVLHGSPPLSVERLLMVTFTEAAGAEMRRRLREGLEAFVASAESTPRAAEQLALLDTALIGTLHGVCYRIVRENAHALGLDPKLMILDATESVILAEQVFRELLESKLGEAAAQDRGLRKLLVDQGGDFAALWKVVHALHRHARSLSDPEGWMETHRGGEEAGTTKIWRKWLDEGVRDWAADAVEVMLELEADFPNRALILDPLKTLATGESTASVSLEALSSLEAKESWPKGKSTACKKRIQWLLDDAEFLAAQCPVAGQDPLGEDYRRVRDSLETFTGLAVVFGRAFEKAKRDRGALDFQDLEQHAIQLLWDRATWTLTPLALDWRERFDEVVVDEYQDINAAQDCILRALAREGERGNRLLVGDVKQSIYRFRLAEPRIFLEYERRWACGGGAGRTILLSENFRSHQRVLEFVNAVFSRCMKNGLDGVHYAEEAHLKLGAGADRPHRAARDQDPARVEFWMTDTKAGEGDSEPEDAGGSGETWLDEARRVASGLLAMHRESRLVWDDTEQRERAMRWEDVVLLMRSPKSGAWAFTQAFAEAGIPLSASREGFFETREVMDVLNLLAILDNPTQDIPLLGVLHSPLAGLDATDLGLIRAATPKGGFWPALQRFPQAASGLAERLAGDSVASRIVETQAKVVRFLEHFRRWRGMVRHASLSEAVETILDETAYEPRTRHLPGSDPHALGQLIEMARRFDALQGQGLHRFMRWMETRREAGSESERTGAAPAGAARLMSIHKSKGLEFPIVVVAGLGSKFNFEDLRAAVIVDERYGLCLKAQLPESRRAYPTAPHWLAARRQRADLMGEEMRLLYVAFTRAKDWLILSAIGNVSTMSGLWARPCHRSHLLTSQRPLDWIGMTFAEVIGEAGWFGQSAGESRLVRWSIGPPIHGAPAADAVKGMSADASAAGDLSTPTPDQIAAWQRRITWRYAHTAATSEPAKMSVSALRRRVEEAREVEFDPPPFQSRTRRRGKGVDPAMIGSATHAVLEHLDLGGGMVTEEQARSTARRLVERGMLVAEAAGAVDFRSIAEFWTGSLGRELMEQPGLLRRELAFTGRWLPEELHAMGLPLQSGGLSAEDGFLVVQGVVDLACIGPRSLRLVDFKTDRIRDEEDLRTSVARHEPQIRVYASAMERIYGRPVSDAWLHFLSAGQSVCVGLGKGTEGGAGPR